MLTSKHTLLRPPWTEFQTHSSDYKRSIGTTAKLDCSNAKDRYTLVIREIPYSYTQNRMVMYARTSEDWICVSLEQDRISMTITKRHKRHERPVKNMQTVVYSDQIPEGRWYFQTGQMPRPIFEPRHEISNKVVCATSKALDQTAHTRRLIRAFASLLNILWVLSYWLNIIWSF